jgi:hypothetical protein
MGAGPDQVEDQDVQSQRLDRAGRPLWNEGKRSIDVAGTGRLERRPCAVFSPGR